MRFTPIGSRCRRYRAREPRATDRGQCQADLVGGDVLLRPGPLALGLSRDIIELDDSHEMTFRISHGQAADQVCAHQLLSCRQGVLGIATSLKWSGPDEPFQYRKFLASQPLDSTSHDPGDAYRLCEAGARRNPAPAAAVIAASRGTPTGRGREESALWRLQLKAQAESPLD